MTIPFTSKNYSLGAPGVLSQLQAEMRTGSISDDMWDVYMPRILQLADSHLNAPPFSK